MVGLECSAAACADVAAVVSDVTVSVDDDVTVATGVRAVRDSVVLDASPKTNTVLSTEMHMKTKGEEGPLSKIDKSIKSSLKVVVNYFAMEISIG